MTFKHQKSEILKWPFSIGLLQVCVSWGLKGLATPMIVRSSVLPPFTARFCPLCGRPRDWEFSSALGARYSTNPGQSNLSQILLHLI